MLQIEFVKDKATKEPFDPTTRLSSLLQEKGLETKHSISLYGCSGTVDGVRGDHVILAPPYTVTKEEIDTIVDVTARILAEVLADLSL